MRRRHLLASVPAATASLAGCSGLLSSGDEDPETTTTPSRTTTVPTATTSPVSSAISRAEAELAQAFDHFAEYTLVERGQPNLGREHVSGYGKRPASDPAAVARTELDEVRDSATGEQADAVTALTKLANYTTEKAEQYLYLIAGQIALYKYKAAFAAEDEGLPAARDHARDAQRYFRRGRNYGSQARSLLSELAAGAVVPEVEGFAVEREQTEQEVLAGESPLLQDTAAAFANHAEALELVGDGSDAYEDEDYEIAAARYASATAVMDDADERITALREAEATYHGQFLALVGCQTEGFAEGAAFFYEAANARADGDSERAGRLEREARERFESVQQRCFDEDSSGTTAPEG